MKNNQKGFIVPLVLAIIAIVAIGAGIYYYQKSQKLEVGSEEIGNPGVSTSTNVSVTSTTTVTTPQSTTNTTTSTKISVAGMSQYTDSNFGFSFWYPSSWTITQSLPKMNISLEGQTVNGISIGDNTNSGIGIIEVHTSNTLTIPGHLDTRTYYFNATTHTWMTFSTNYPNPQAADISNNTMGGLHMFSSGAVFYPTIIPLSAHNFLVISDPQGSLNRTDALAKTIVALDPSVATPISQAQQIQTIQAEASAYEVQSTTSTWKTYTNSQYGYQIQYPSTFTQQNIQGGDNTILSFQVNYPSSYFGNTNLGSANVAIQVRATTENACYSGDSVGNPFRPGIETGSPAIVTLNGITFHAANIGDSAMGQNYNESYLNTFHNNACYSIIVSTQSYKQCFADAPDGPSCKNPAPSYNPDIEIFPIFNQIVSTFKFTN